MRCMREHIHRLYFLHPILPVHESEVTSLGGRIATNVHYTLWIGPKDGVYDIGMHAGTWWIGYYHIWSAMFCYERIGKNILHVSCIEHSVGNAIDFRVHLSIFYRLWHILYAHNL